MEVNSLSPKFVPLVDNMAYEKKPDVKPNDTSLLVTTPEEIQRNLEAWRKHEERIHIVV